MLALLGFLMVITFMYLIMSNRMSAFLALIIVPIIYAVIGGFGSQLGPMMFKGVTSLAPTGIMMMFAIIYFGIMVDVGLFDSLIVKILKMVSGDPLKVVVGTAVLATIASLEGEGAVVFMITCTALLPLYRRLNINPIILAVLCTMVTAVKNMFPWTGPTARVLSSLNLEATQVFNPLIPVIIVGFIWVSFAAYCMGKKERARLGIITIEKEMIDQISAEVVSKNPEFKRPNLFWMNLIMTMTLMAGLLLEWVPISIAFEIGTALALLVNFRTLKEQQARLVGHGKEALSVLVVVFAAGIFVGILTGTKMTSAMSTFLISIIPPALGPHMGIITALLSAPLDFFLSNDAFFFGVLPVLNHMAAVYGISAAEIGRASLLGTPIHMLSPLVPSLWLLVGMCDITFGDLQKGGIGWMLGLMIMNIAVALAFGVLSF